MPDQNLHGALYVEGKDDCFAIVHLLERHKIILDKQDGPVVIAPMMRDPTHSPDWNDDEAKSRNEQLTLSAALKGSGTKPVGFALDMDIELTKRWRQVRDRLVTAGLELPTNDVPVADQLPVGGLIVDSNKFGRRVGVWLMPDNRADFGKIEDLLGTLVPPGDDLFEIAKRSTTEALAVSAKRPADRKIIQHKDERKGQLHSWLAWQETPGESYGRALQRKFFEHESAVANAFVEWFKKLYGLS